MCPLHRVEVTWRLEGLILGHFLDLDHSQHNSQQLSCFTSMSTTHIIKPSFKFAVNSQSICYHCKTHETHKPQRSSSNPWTRFFFLSATASYALPITAGHHFGAAAGETHTGSGRTGNMDADSAQPLKRGTAGSSTLTVMHTQSQPAPITAPVLLGTRGGHERKRGPLRTLDSSQPSRPVHVPHTHSRTPVRCCPSKAVTTHTVISRSILRCNLHPSLLVLPAPHRVAEQHRALLNCRTPSQHPPGRLPQLSGQTTLPVQPDVAGPNDVRGAPYYSLWGHLRDNRSSDCLPGLQSMPLAIGPLAPESRRDVQSHVFSRFSRCDLDPQQRVRAQTARHCYDMRGDALQADCPHACALPSVTPLPVSAMSKPCPTDWSSRG